MSKRSFNDPSNPAISRWQFGIILRALYPGCPTDHRGLMLKRLARKAYRGRLLTISAMVVDNSVRHHLTEYEQLIYAPGENALSRADARQVVTGQVAAIIASWQEASALEDPHYQAMRQRLLERRLQEEPSPMLTQEENAAIIEELTRWLREKGEAVSDPTRAKRPKATRSTQDVTSRSKS